MRLIYLAQENSDQTEGRGVMITFAAFTYRADAEMAVKGHGVMGFGDGRVKEVRVFDSYSEWASEVKLTLRQRALAKLTPAEREELGF